ncbi:hypothetical protein B0J12DRAFT_746681 [Macrophomina phaseolina]|uniref:Uncharacterized protein n=1 Tax=Macrophomina phaseolina TaxID=35725 RepID=A0ABQ8FRS4_9PEZI|nr:hypothetical protein B0J12DRAFT_746681 [Macrophomina phaseolina]
MPNGTFTITAPPGTDIWRKPPSTNRRVHRPRHQLITLLTHPSSFNAPTLSLLSDSEPVPLKSFQRARITLASPWTTRYDQGGLLLHATHPSQQDRWLKTGIEFYQSRPYLSTVATLTYSDWSVAAPSDGAVGASVTVEVRRESDELGTSLWVYEVVGGEERPLRECTWWFAEEDDGWVVDVRAMAARPAEKESVVGAEGLVVSFSGAEVEVK